LAFARAKTAQAHRVPLMQLHPVIIHARHANHFIQLRQVKPNGLAIISPNERRIGHHGFAALHVQKSRGLIEIEIELFLVQQMKRHYVVFFESQMLDGGFQFRRRHEEIGQNDYQRPLTDLLRRIVQRREQRGAAHGPDARHLIQHHSKMRSAAPGRNLHGGLREAPQSHGVSLLRGDIAQRARQPPRVVEPSGARRSEIHGAAGVDQQAEAQIRIRLEFLDIKAVASPPGPPVQPPGVVARNVFPVLRELQ
jgi:hypothetical protein